MACPTCDHTMQRIVDSLSWCPRCGTLKTSGVPEHLEVERPKLIDRLRTYETRMRNADDDREMWGEPVGLTVWNRIGISESINLPDARPK